MNPAAASVAAFGPGVPAQLHSSKRIESAMIERLYILRHGIAVPPETPDFADDDRPLTPRGKRRMRRIGGGLDRLDLNLDRIATSPLPRARKSAELVADALGLGDLIDDADELRAGGGAAAVRDWLGRRSEARLMIVGHNPMLSELVGLLVLGDAHAPWGELKKGGVAALARVGESGERYHVQWIAGPRLLRKLS